MVETRMPGPEWRGHLNHCQAGRCWQGMSHSGSQAYAICIIFKTFQVFPSPRHTSPPRELCCFPSFQCLNDAG